MKKEKNSSHNLTRQQLENVYSMVRFDILSSRRLRHIERFEESVSKLCGLPFIGGTTHHRYTDDFFEIGLGHINGINTIILRYYPATLEIVVSADVLFFKFFRGLQKYM